MCYEWYRMCSLGSDAGVLNVRRGELKLLNGSEKECCRSSGQASRLAQGRQVKVGIFEFYLMWLPKAF